MELVDALVAERTAEDPAKCAIVDGDRRLSYGDVGARAEEMARRLAALGVGQGDFVAVCLGRCAELVIAELASLRLGAAYVPIAVSQPPDRTRLMLECCRARAIVRSGESGEIEIEPILPAPAAVPRAGARSGDDAACVMFTSGSTGAPKGVVVPHRAIFRLLAARDYATVGPADVVGFVSNPAFDASTWETWGALAGGATLVVVSRDATLSPPRLAAAIRTHGITTMFLTTALFNHVVRTDPDTLRGLRTLLFGGESCDVEMVRRAHSAGSVPRLVHVYGPTECTTFALFHEVGAHGRDDVTESGTTVPIGRPIRGTTAHVLSPDGQPVADGSIGELYLGGDRLAVGYLGDDVLTASRFVGDHLEPGGGRRLYRTGDLVRRRAGGLLDYAGRADRQVKVRGFRVQLEELEIAATEHPSVRRAVAFVRAGPDGHELALVAESDALDEAGLRMHVGRHLPPEIVPERITVVPALPLTDNGKLDRRMLERTMESAHRPSGHRRSLADVDPAVLVAWRRAVGGTDVDPDATFFDLGVSSLRAARMLEEVRRATGVDLPLSTLVDHPTLRMLSAAVAARRGLEASRNDSRSAIAELRPGDAAPLVMVHCYEGAAYFYRPLLAHLRTRRAVLSLDELRFAGRWRRGESVAGIAEACLRGWEERRPPDARVVLGGYSAGGGIAYEMACRLLARGTSVEAIVLLEPASAIPMYDRQVMPTAPPGAAGTVESLVRSGKRTIAWWGGFLRRRVVDLRVAGGRMGIHGSIESRNRLNFDRHWALMSRYHPGPLPKSVPVLFVACTGGRDPVTLERYLDGWRPLLGDLGEIHRVEGTHSGDAAFLAEPHVAEVARRLDEFLATRLPSAEQESR